MVKIFVPQAIPEAAISRLDEIGDLTVFEGTDGPMPKDEIIAAVGDTEIMYALGEVEFDADVIAAAKSLQLVAAMHMKATFVDQAACTARGVPVSGLPNFVSKTAAEFTFALLMTTAWRLPEATQFLADGKWTQNQSTAFTGTRMYGKTLGIVGMGTIGSHVARRAAACDMNIIYTQRNRLSPAQEFTLGNAEFRSLEDLCMESDFITLCPALTADTKGLINKELISLMKPSTILINTSRGPIIDEAALLEALTQGRLRGAGLDVYTTEVPEQNPGPLQGFYDLPNVVLTPHIGSAARETRDEMAMRTVNNIVRFLDGKRPFDILNPEVYGGAARNDEVIG
jgi:glyoxylate reductase